MPNIYHSDMTYCTLCDRYFPGEQARAVHVQLSPNHPKCDTCDRRFANKNSLRNHWVCSSRHHYCVVCDREFRTEAGLRIHIEQAAVHRDDTDDDSDDDDDIDDSSEGWEDELGQRVYPEMNEQSEVETGGDYATDDMDYWTQDETEDFEEDRDAYDGFAHTSTVLATQETKNENFENWKKAKAVDGQATKNAPVSSAQLICPVCLETPKECSATRCGHLFCTPCIQTALANKKMCPKCRDFAVPKQLRKIYLSIP